MATYHAIKFPGKSYNSSYWLGQLINSLRAYAMEQWNHRNDAVHGATLSAQKQQQVHLIYTQLTTSYQNQSLAPSNKCGHLFGLPLSLRLTHSLSAITAPWLAIYRAGQLHLASKVRQDKCRQGTIRQFLIRQVLLCRPDSPV